jgi:nitrogen fixation NifU-like protein
VSPAAEKRTDELRALYRELILDHARSPRHFGKLADSTHSAEGINPLCGDKLKMYFRISESDLIDDACFEGSGCAISVASASLLTDAVIGMSTRDALRFFDALVASLGTDDDASSTIDLGKLKALQGVKEFPSRVKCASLAWHALNSAIHQDKLPASTE